MNEDAWDLDILYLEDIKDSSEYGYCSLCGCERDKTGVADECTGECEVTKDNSFTRELKF